MKCQAVSHGTFDKDGIPSWVQCGFVARQDGELCEFHAASQRRGFPITLWKDRAPLTQPLPQETGHDPEAA